MVRYRDLVEDTICSPITALGHAGVAVIRISGSQSLKVAKSFVSSWPDTLESHKSWLSFVKDTNKKKVDQVLVNYFAKGRSFTGDETVELSCHGNPLIVNQIIDLCLDNGCRMAERGEFSFRAYYNGQLDLVQAESIQDLVTSKSSRQSSQHLAHLEGGLSDLFQNIEIELVSILSQLEASIDFVEEDIQIDTYGKIQGEAQALMQQVEKLVNSYDTGRQLSKGSKILLLGETNVGKSSLFNSLLKTNRAIVTDIPGTTRDSISEQTFLGHSAIELVDSAGLRETEDKVEAMGIERTREQAKESDLILQVLSAEDLKLNSLLEKPMGQPRLVVINKMDLIGDSEEVYKTIGSWVSAQPSLLNESDFCFVSATKGTGLEDLKNKMERLLLPDWDQQEVMVTQARHHNHLVSAQESLLRSLTMIKNEESPDLISQELQLALSEVYQILGKEYDDEILDKIFSSFCIGK